MLFIDFSKHLHRYTSYPLVAGRYISRCTPYLHFASQYTEIPPASRQRAVRYRHAITLLATSFHIHLLPSQGSRLFDIDMHQEHHTSLALPISWLHLHLSDLTAEPKFEKHRKKSKIKKNPKTIENTKNQKKIQQFHMSSSSTNTKDITPTTNTLNIYNTAIYAVIPLSRSIECDFLWSGLGW